MFFGNVDNQRCYVLSIWDQVISVWENQLELLKGKFDRMRLAIAGCSKALYLATLNSAKILIWPGKASLAPIPSLSQVDIFLMPQRKIINKRHCHENVEEVKVYSKGCMKNFQIMDLKGTLQTWTTRWL